MHTEQKYGCIDDAKVAREGRTPITEEDDREVIDRWYAQAKEQTTETVGRFIQHLVQDYEHDYGTIVHAISAGAIAAAHAIDHDPEQGGITGFQASAIAMMFYARTLSIDGPLRIVQMRDLLYPQNVGRFVHISQSTWQWVQAEARKMLEEMADQTKASQVHPDVRKHWESIVSGHVPFGLKIKDD